MENSPPCGKPEKPHSMPFMGFYPQSYPHVHWEWGCCMSNSPVNGHLSIVNGRWQLTVDNQKISTPLCSLSGPIPWAYPQSYPHLWITSGGKLPSLWKTRNPLFRRLLSSFSREVMHRNRTNCPEYAILYPYNLWNSPVPVPYNVAGTLQDTGCLETAGTSAVFFLFRKSTAY